MTARQRFTFSGVLLAALLVVSLLTGCAGVRLHECTLPDQPKWAMALEPLPEIDGRSLMTRISEWKKSGQRQSLLAVLAGWFSDQYLALKQAAFNRGEKHKVLKKYILRLHKDWEC